MRRHSTCARLGERCDGAPPGAAPWAAAQKQHDTTRMHAATHAHHHRTAAVVLYRTASCTGLPSDPPGAYVGALTPPARRRPHAAFGFARHNVSQALLHVAHVVCPLPPPSPPSGPRPSDPPSPPVERQRLHARPCGVPLQPHAPLADGAQVQGGCGRGPYVGAAAAAPPVGCGCVCPGGSRPVCWRSCAFARRGWNSCRSAAASARLQAHTHAHIHTPGLMPLGDAFSRSQHLQHTCIHMHIRLTKSRDGLARLRPRPEPISRPCQGRSLHAQGFDWVGSVTAQ